MDHCETDFQRGLLIWMLLPLNHCFKIRIYSGVFQSKVQSSKIHKTIHKPQSTIHNPHLWSQRRFWRTCSLRVTLSNDEIFMCFFNRKYTLILDFVILNMYAKFSSKEKKHRCVATCVASNEFWVLCKLQLQKTGLWTPKKHNCSVT